MKACTMYCIILATCSLLLLKTQRIHADSHFHLINSVEDPCKTLKGDIHPHPNLCQLHYNCSSNGQFEQWSHLHECTYPDLFSLESMSCEPFEKAVCGKDRLELIHACDYLQNQCLGPNCRPCGSRWPKCEIENGLTHYQDMVGSPFYGVCKGWRVVERHQCVKGIFDKDTKTCVKP